MCSKIAAMNARYQERKDRFRRFSRQENEKENTKRNYLIIMNLGTIMLWRLRLILIFCYKKN